jgi:hypothetical protein
MLRRAFRRDHNEAGYLLLLGSFFQRSDGFVDHRPVVLKLLQAFHAGINDFHQLALGLCERHIVIMRPKFSHERAY